jgi:hypothetical protein
MSMTIHVKSPAELKASLQRLIKVFPEGVAQAEWEFVQQVLNDSDPNVPVDFGYLRSTRYSNDPVIESGMISTEYGYWASYARPVHDIPPPPDVSEGGRSAYHAHGTYQFLKIATDKDGPYFPEKCVAKVEQMLGGEL